MGSVNKVILFGNLGADPEVRSFPNGGRVGSFSLATSQRWRDKTTGDPREKTEWHRVAVYSDGLIEVVRQYLRKGASVYVEGQLETRKWQDQSGADRYTTEVAVRQFNGSIVLTERRETGAGAGGAPPGDPGRQAPALYAPRATSPNPTAGLDDEIPF